MQDIGSYRVTLGIHSGCNGESRGWSATPLRTGRYIFVARVGNERGLERMPLNMVCGCFFFGGFLFDPFSALS